MYYKNKIKKSTILALLLSTVIQVLAQPLSPQEEKEACLNIHNEWMKMNLDLTKNTVGYSAPVAARSLNYISIGMYETAVDMMQDYRSVNGQLMNYNRPSKHKSVQLSYQHLCNIVDVRLSKFFYQNMPPANLKKVDELFYELYYRYRHLYTEDELAKTEYYAEKIADAIMIFSKKDRGANAWNRNFPKEYQPPKCDGCWVKTLPGHVDPLQPYWGKNILMIESNKSVCSDMTYLEFSLEKGSEFCKEAQMVKDLVHSKEEEDIAEYWNDAPGVSGTPIGHLYQIAFDLAKKEQFGLDKTMETYLLLGLAVNDAVIESWKLKYEYNLIRPITYIHRYISADFTPAITTPPFPEFPSGHSFQAGAGTEVFNHVFGKKYKFTDNTNTTRTDINGESRSYSSFDEMGEEMSISRFYGGIHYKNTLTVSLEYGRKIGVNTISTIQIKKK